MVKLSVCIEPFFSELPYADRIRKVAELGFTTYEFWFHDRRYDGKGLVPEDKDFHRIAELNAKYGLTTAAFVFNHPDGGIKASLVRRKDRGMLLDSIEGMIDRAKSIGCKAFISGSGNRVAGQSRQESTECLIESLSAMARVCEKRGVTLLLEPFNTKIDHPDCFLDDPQACVDILRAVNSPSARMLFDVYHMQIMSGNILTFLKENLSWVGHFHLAAVPGRHELDQGELDYPAIVREVDRMGYTGCFGLEYWPTLEPGDSLRRAREALGGQ